ncbi:MAG: PilZ domain-containing protein [Chthonomonas sp.]|nr:PilZ domain-containing protein [Chthonomonas sp.]
MAIDFLQYIGTRARCQRIEDARLLRGWVVEFDQQLIVLRFDADRQLAVGERVAFELQGSSNNVFAIGEVESLEDDLVRFKLTSNLRLTSPTESVRFQATRFGIFCDLTHGDQKYDMDVQDISSSGVGLVGLLNIERGTVVDIAVHSAHGTVTGKGEVRYCKPEDSHGRFRLGIKLHIEDRISRGRWLRLFPNAA